MKLQKFTQKYSPECITTDFHEIKGSLMKSSSPHLAQRKPKKMFIVNL